MKALLWVVAVMVAAAALATGVPAMAHHSHSPFYDDSKSVEAIGTVTKFVFRNPHSYLYLEAPNAEGSMIAWEIEMGASVTMSRRGWTPETIKAGDPIKVTGRPSRAPGTYGMCCAELTKPDGSPIRP